MKYYPISETFFSVQGEGMHCGKAAFFVRTFGCNVKCDWCDSKYAWRGEPAQILSAVEIAEQARASGAEIAVITGGEPCVHNLTHLVAELDSRKIASHLETSGTLMIAEDEIDFDWVALSPKIFSPPLKASVARADELKLIVSCPADMSRYEEIIADAARAQAIWLNPEWSHSTDKDLLAFICEYVKSRGARFRAGWQMHKNYFIR